MPGSPDSLIEGIYVDEISSDLQEIPGPVDPDGAKDSRRRLRGRASARQVRLQAGGGWRGEGSWTQDGGPDGEGRCPRRKGGCGGSEAGPEGR